MLSSSSQSTHSSHMSQTSGKLTSQSEAMAESNEKCSPGFFGQVVGYLSKWTLGEGSDQKSESEEDHWEVHDFNSPEKVAIDTQENMKSFDKVRIENYTPVSQPVDVVQQATPDPGLAANLSGLDKNNTGTEGTQPNLKKVPSSNTSKDARSRKHPSGRKDNVTTSDEESTQPKQTNSRKKGNKRPNARKKASDVGSRTNAPKPSETTTDMKPRQKGKKPPMRTARDVINRIQWDRNLPEDYFDIGYIDRFLGVVEKPFTAFTWGDLAWIDFDALGIPQHRIQYFKYRGSIVWEKSERFDAVFGSSGTDDNIETSMTRIDAEIEAERERKATEREAQRALAALDVDIDCSSIFREDAEGLVGNSSNIDADLFPDDSEDDEDSAVNVGFLQPLTSPSSGGIFGVPEEERSTHFIAVRITDPHVQQHAVAVQRSVVEHDPALSTCAMRPTLFHVTLCMLRLQDAEAVAAAGDCISTLVDDLETTLRADDGTLHMRGLRTFGSRVLYTPVSPCSSFSVVNEEARRRLRHVPGVTLTNSFDYVPHMTLVKVSRPVARLRRSKFIDSAGYLAHEKTDFGAQRFDNLHLCAIDADCALDGFYVTARSITF